MSERINDLTGEIAIKPARMIVVVYVIIKQAVYIIGVDGYYWIPRGVAGILMMAAIMYTTDKRRFAIYDMSYLAPLSIMLIEIILCAIIRGDRLIYTFLMGCGLISLLFLDLKGLLITVSVSSTSIGVLALIFRFPMLGEAYTYADEVFNFIGYIIISILIYFIGRYSVSKFRQFRQTGMSFEAILRTTPNHLITIDDRARVVYISKSFADWLGIAKHEYAKGRPLLDLCRWGELKMIFQEVMESGTYVEKSFELTIDSKQYWFMLRSSLMEGSHLARFIELTDITPIMEAKLEAEAATKAKSNFLANMSHEIRTPMNAIVGLVELLMLKPLDQEQLSHAMSIKGSSMALLNIINDILDFSKIDAQKMEIIEKPFDFTSLINDTINIINIKASSAGIKFTAYISKELPPQVNGDELRIKQILLNLLNNAIKFTREGCVSLFISSETMQDGTLVLKFAVKDTGIGIKSEDMDKLFSEFQQMDTRKNRGIEGTGLGLAISRRLAELMGGSIGIESVYGKGSTFSFEIPCKGVHGGHIVNLAQPERYNVLCYEPDGYHADALSQILTGLEVRHELCRSLDGFGAKLDEGGYTHVFYDMGAHRLIGTRTGDANVSYIMLKEIQELADTSSNAINRPVIVTSVAHVLTGEAEPESVVSKNDDIKLGAFKTRDVRALLVDDNSINLTVAEGLLREYGIDVVTASGGQEGIDKAAAGNLDIIFMDHMMPEIDGIDATRAIRAFGGIHETLPIIALSANAITGVEDVFLESGMNGFLSKPIIVKNLHKTLLEFLPPEKIVWEN